MRLMCFLLLAGICQANPMANAWVQKVQERCDVRIGTKFAKVRCDITYQVWDEPTETLFLEVPIYLPDSVDLDEKKLEWRVNCELEMAGKTYRPYRVSKDTSAREVEWANCVKCTFLFRQPPSPKRFRVIVSYDQPMIGNRFYYLPQFEYGPFSVKFEDFMFYAALADIRGNLKLASENKYVTERNPGSIRMNILNQGLIAIELAGTKESKSAGRQ